MLCYHDTYSTNLTPCNLASCPVFALTSALALPAHSRTQLCCLSSLPLQQEKKEWDLGCTAHFLLLAAAVLPFPHITWQKSRVTLDVQWVEIRSVYERNIGKVGIFSSSSFPLSFWNAASVVKPNNLDLQQDENEKIPHKWSLFLRCTKPLSRKFYRTTAPGGQQHFLFSIRWWN